MLDLAPVTRHLRAKATSHLLVAAVHHFNIFEILSDEPLYFDELRNKLQLKPRPAMVLFPALCAMGLLELSADKKLSVSELGRFLVRKTPGHLVGYTALESQDPGVIRLAEWLRNDGPADPELGLSYVKDDLAESPMDEPEAARFFTMALAGRAKYLSPIVASHLTRKKGHLLDIAGGTGYYSYEWLLVNPESTATIVDRPEVLRIAGEVLDTYPDSSLKERVSFHPADMLTEPLPTADIILAASLFHDWPEDICETLMKKFATSLHENGEIWIHDAFLNDSLDGPLAVTDYSAMLFLATKGRCYSRQEYGEWFLAAGLKPSGKYIPTLMDYGLIAARKGL